MIHHTEICSLSSFSLVFFSIFETRKLYSVLLISQVRMLCLYFFTSTHCKKAKVPYICYKAAQLHPSCFFVLHLNHFSCTACCRLSYANEIIQLSEAKLIFCGIQWHSHDTSTSCILSSYFVFGYVFLTRFKQALKMP